LRSLEAGARRSGKAKSVTAQKLDEAKAEAFGGRMTRLLNDSFLAILVSIGHQTGLYDTMAELAPSTSAEIAVAAGLNERYVREWLGAMVVGGIAEYEPATQRYVLPPEHAGMLTRAAGPDNFAFFMQYLALTGNVEPLVVEAFRNGGGAPYSAYPKFQALQSEETSRVYDLALVSAILPLAPGVVARLEEGIDVADIGCGQGHALNVMAKAFPRSRFTGFDFSAEGIAAAQAEAKATGLANATFEVKDVASLSGPPSFDLITAFDTIHDQAAPRKVLKGIFDSLRVGGTFLMGDIAASSVLEENLEHPLGPLLYSVSVLHCMTVSLAQGGEGLGTVWGEQRARELLAEAGFTEVATASVPGDIFNLYYAAPKR
jgi:SAM-dependent methyltransferase